MWRDNFMGGNGNPVTSGPFKDTEWEVFGDPTGSALRREMGTNVSYLPSTAQVNACQSITPFDVSPYHEPFPPARTGGYANAAEGWVYGGPGAQPGSWSTGMHNCAHVWIGGHMLEVPIAPNDPAFYLNHAHVDWLWAKWQLANPSKAGQYPADAVLPAQNARGLPRKRSDKMKPWDGTAGSREWTVVKCLNFQKMGSEGQLPNIFHDYTYDSMGRRSLSFTP
jgi:tyrosinase